MIRSRGHCNTMGTASTMACMAEALGMTIPGVAGIPAPDSRLLESAHAAGRLAVEMVAAGPEAAVEQMIEACWTGPPAAAVHIVQRLPAEDDGLSGFSERPTV